MAARNGADFDRLWHGDTAGYPSHSEADLALCYMLAFWTGRDPGRIDRLFRPLRADAREVGARGLPEADDRARYAAGRSNAPIDLVPRPRPDLVPR